MSDVKLQYNIYDNLIGISSGTGQAGIWFYGEDERSLLINSQGYNISATGSTESCGIRSQGGKMQNCIGKSLAGNGIISNSSTLENCIGIAGGTTAGSPLSFYSFRSYIDNYYNNCSSQVGSNNSYPLIIEGTRSFDNFDQNPLQTKFENCSFSSINNNAIDFDSSSITRFLRFAGARTSTPDPCFKISITSSGSWL